LKTYVPQFLIILILYAQKEKVPLIAAPFLLIIFYAKFQ
jgi:hypothetical protein